MCKISGFVGKPEAARKKGAHQFFFVNGRYMKHPYFNKAVMTAYDRLVPQGEQVPYFLYFDVNPNDIDVNIHPTKTEIKFENEQAIWQILMAAVKESIGMFNDVPSIDFDTEDKPDIPVYNPDMIPSASAPKISLNPHYNPFKSSPSSGKPAAAKSVDEQWEQLYEGLNDQDSVEREADIFESENETEINTSQSILAEKSPAHYQYKGKYVMTAVKSGLMIIDQHRAHVRVLYERYLEQIQQQTSHSQKVLFPEVLQFPVSDEVILEKLLPEMNKMGFELDGLGGGSYAVNAIPTGLDGVNPLHLVQDMVFSAKEKGVKALDEVHQSLALTLARNAAIPQGQVLSNEEMESLVNDLFACSNVNYTPDGKNVLCILKQQEIEHLLG